MKLYPVASERSSIVGGISMKTAEQVRAEDIPKHLVHSPLLSVRLRDILNAIQSKVVILKIDLEGYECKALEPEILQNRVGKFIPFILMEWVQLPNNEYVCGNFNDWVENFYQGGYVPVDPGEGRR